jgi:hypothetical protein
MNEVILKNIQDRIDYLRLKYRDTQGEERLEWKARFNEAQNIKSIVDVAINLQKKDNQNA